MLRRTLTLKGSSNRIFLEGIRKTEIRSTKCVELIGDYVEKKILDVRMFFLLKRSTYHRTLIIYE